MNIAVCYDESLIRKRLDQMGEHHYLLSRLDTYETAEELLDSPESYDLVLVDGGAWREMQRSSERSRGIVRKEQETCGPSEARREAGHGFGREAEPIVCHGRKERKDRSPGDAGGDHPDGTDRRELRIRTGQQSFRIPAEHIVYAENDRKKIILHTDSEIIEYVATMRDLEKRLGSGFFRCHRGYLINLSRVCDHSTDMILMDNGDEVYLSRRKLAEFELHLRERQRPGDGKYFL